MSKLEIGDRVQIRSDFPFVSLEQGFYPGEKGTIVNIDFFHNVQMDCTGEVICHNRLELIKLKKKSKLTAETLVNELLNMNVHGSYLEFKNMVKFVRKHTELK